MLVDLGPAPTKKKATGLVDLGPAPTPITEALKAVEPTAEDLEKYRRMGVKEYRPPEGGRLYDLTKPEHRGPVFPTTPRDIRPPFTAPKRTPMRIGPAPKPTGWQKFKGFFVGDRRPLPPDADRMEKVDRAFDIAIGSPLRVFLKFSKGINLNIPDLMWAGIKRITPESMWDEEVKNMNLDQAMDWAAGYDPSGFEKTVGSLAEFVGRLRTAGQIGTSLGLLGKTPKDISVLTKASETAKLFGLGAGFEQIAKNLAEKVEPTEAVYGAEGKEAILRDMAIGAILSIAHSGVKGIWTKLRPTEQTRALKLLGLKKGATETEIIKASRRMALKTHPDKVKGLEGQFKKIMQAREFLIKGPKKDIIYAKRPPKPPAQITGKVAKPMPTPIQAELDARQAADIAAMDAELAQIQRQPPTVAKITPEKPIRPITPTEPTVAPKAEGKVDKLQEMIKKHPGTLTVAVKLDSGEIIADPKVGNHGELLDKYNLDLNKVADGGFVVGGEYISSITDAKRPSPEVIAAEIARPTPKPTVTAPKAEGIDKKAARKYWIRSYSKFDPRETEASHWGKGQAGFNISKSGKVFLSANEKVKKEGEWQYPTHRDLVKGEGKDKTLYPGIYSWTKENALWLYPDLEKALNPEMKKGLASLIGVHKITADTPVKSNTSRKTLFKLGDIAPPTPKPAAKEAWEMKATEIIKKNLAGLPKDTTLSVQHWEGQPTGRVLRDVEQILEEPRKVTGSIDESDLGGKRYFDRWKHRQAIQQAIKQGKPVPLEVLEEYKSEKWAQEALAAKPKLVDLGPAKEAPKAEVEIRDLSEKTRKTQIKQTENAISKHGIYEVEAETIKETSEFLGHYYIPTKSKGELRKATGTLGSKGFKAALYKRFTFDPKEGKHWDEEAMEYARRTGTEQMNIDDFIDRVAQAVEAQKMVGKLNEQALSRAIASGDPYFEILAMKREMLKDGLTAAEINDNIREQAKHYGISEKDITAELVPVERVEYVEKKPRVAEEMARKGRQAKARLTPEQAAIFKAKQVATKGKINIYVYERKDRFVVSKNPPTKGIYTKVSPPAPGEITTTVTQETGKPIAKTQKDAAIIRAQAAAKKVGKDFYIRQNQEGKFFATKNKPISNYYIVNPQGKVRFVKGPAMANVLQRAKALEIAEGIGLINKKGKPTQSYRRFARAMTGKTSIDKMGEGEAAYFIDMLGSLTVDYRGVAKIPTSKDIITKELADKIGKFKDIGALEKIRPAWRVFEKMGLYKEVFEPAFDAEISSIEELFGFRAEARQMQKLIGKDKPTSRKLFRALENPGKIKLTSKEAKVVKWGQKYFRDWADRLGLTAEQRRKNYITHIFEREIDQLLKEKHPLDPDLVRALEFITPKTVFNPYLQKRLGKKVGLKEDFWAAIEAYENRAIKKFYYEPLIKRVRVYQRFLPPNSAKYLRNYIARITKRPLTIDREFNQTLKEIARDISKLPGGKKLAQHLTKGNAAGMLAYNMTGLYYEAWLGLRPASAIKNLSQHGLILAEAGPVAFTRALKTVGTKRASLLLHSKVLRSRKSGYLPGIDQTYIKNLESKRRKITMAMFRAADRQNVSDAFLAGYHEAKAKGLSDEWAFKRGDEVARKTQWLYSKLAGAEFMQTSPGRVLGVLTTWPENWAELMNDWIRAKPSQVYVDYTKATGKEIPKVNWAKRRKSLWTYLAMVSLAMLIHKKTPFKAIYYTGWTSIKSLVDIASGKLAGLEIPRIVGNLIVGLALGDKRRLKQSWNEAKRFVVIGKELSDIITGKKDWINLFIYMETPKKKKEEGKRKTRMEREKRMLRK